MHARTSDLRAPLSARRTRTTLLACLLCALPLAGFAQTPTAPATPPVQDGATTADQRPPPDATASTQAETETADAFETRQEQRLAQAKSLIERRRSADALPLIGQSIVEYEQRHPEGETRWFVSRDTAETLAYLVLANVEADRAAKPAASGDAGTVAGNRHKDAVALTSMWSEAYYMKAYALYELAVESGGYAHNTQITDDTRIAQAKAALARGLSLQPYHARMHAELGQIHQLEKNWNAALAAYTAAEDAAAFSPEEERTADLTRAKRGIGFVLIELGRLKDAERKFRECLKLDPKDAGAKRELEYIRHLRANSI